jgi:hypothetical protein
VKGTEKLQFNKNWQNSFIFNVIPLSQFLLTLEILHKHG